MGQSVPAMLFVCKDTTSEGPCQEFGAIIFWLTSFEMFPVIVQHINILTVTVKNDSMTRKTEKIKKGGIMRREKVEK